MTYEQYLSKRSALIDDLQKLIDDSASEDLYQKKKAEVENLDSKWAEYADRQANLNALSDDQPVFCPPWHEPGTVAGGVNFLTGRNYTGGSLSGAGTVFLNERRSMTDLARERGNNRAEVLNIENALGDTIKGIVTGRWDNPVLKDAVTTSGTSVLIPEVLSAQVIDLARSISLFGQAAVPVVPMETNNMTISRIKTDPVFKFKQERSAVDESSFELDGVELKSKTIYGYAYVTLEALQSSKNLDSIIRQTFAAAIAQGIDKAMLYGQANEDGFDTFAPSGIMNDEDILSVASEGGYSDFVKAAGKIRRNNGVPTVAALNAATDEALQLLTDKNGVYLTPPQAFSSLNKIVTNQLIEDETNGSDALVFDPHAMLIGIQNNVRIKVLEGTDEGLKKGLVAFQIYAMLDCKVVRPKAICKITGIGLSGE